MKNWLLILMVLIFSFNTFSQNYNYKIDSIDMLLNNAKNRTNRIELIFAKIKIYTNNKEYIQAEKLSNLALLISKETKDVDLIAKSYYYLGYSFHKQGKQKLALKNYYEIILLKEKISNNRVICDAYFESGYIYMNIGILDKAILYLEKSNEVLEDKGNEVEKAKTISNIGYLYEISGKYDKALVLYREALTVFKKFEDEKAQAYVFNNIGALYREIGSYDKTIEYYNKSLAIKIKTGDSISLSTTYNNLGVTYQKYKKYKKSNEYLYLALELSQKYNDSRRAARSINNLGTNYELQENYKKALEFYNKSLLIKDSINDIQGKILSYLNIGKVCVKMKDYKNSAINFKKGIKLADSLNFVKELSELYNNLSLLYEDMHDFKNALIFQKKYSIIKDTLLNNSKQKNIDELEIKYQTERKEEQLESLKKENENKEKILFRNNYLTIAGILLLILVSSFIYVFNNRKKLKAINRNIILEQKLLRTQMNPHFIFNSLSAIQAYIYENEPLQAGKYVSDFAKLMRLILENSRKNFITLEKEIETLEYYLKLQQLRFDNRFTYDIIIVGNFKKENCLIPPMLAQPIIENAIEHGVRGLENGNINIFFKKQNNEIFVKIEDNGNGMLKTSNQKGNHESYAMKIVQERLYTYNKDSKIDVKSSNKGTEISFFIPIKPFKTQQNV